MPLPLPPLSARSCQVLSGCSQNASELLCRKESHLHAGVCCTGLFSWGLHGHWVFPAGCNGLWLLHGRLQPFAVCGHHVIHHLCNFPPLWHQFCAHLHILCLHPGHHPEIHALLSSSTKPSLPVLPASLPHPLLWLLLHLCLAQLCLCPGEGQGGLCALHHGDAYAEPLHIHPGEPGWEGCTEETGEETNSFLTEEK